MDGSGGSVSRGRRRWLLVAAGVWSVLGLWNLADGDVLLGLAEIVLAGITVTAALSARMAAIIDAPLFRRK